MTKATYRRVYLGLWHQKDRISSWQEVCQQVAGISRKLSAHFLNGKHKAERTTWKWLEDFLSKPVSSDILPSSKSHH